jgi:S1-C subfamily serine protease
MRGALVLNVVPGSPAAQVGIVGTQRHPESGEIVLGDLITHIDAAELSNATDLYLQLEKHKPGDTVTVTASRNATSRTLSVVLAKNVSD